MTQSPDSNDQKPPEPQSPSLGWRLFFGFQSMIIFLNILSVGLVETIGFIEIIDFVVTNLAFVGLCGFIFSKPIGDVVFWRYFFYVALAEAFVVLIVLPIFRVPVYGTAITFNWWIVNIVITYFSLLALNLYAYKRPFIWHRTSP